MTEKWFKPGKHTGWKKSQSTATRRRHLLDATDKRKSLDARYLEAGRRSQALANVTEDKRTSELAGRDARYFFAKAKKQK